MKYLCQFILTLSICWMYGYKIWRHRKSNWLIYKRFINRSNCITSGKWINFSKNSYISCFKCIYFFHCFSIHHIKMINFFFYTFFDIVNLISNIYFTRSYPTKRNFSRKWINPCFENKTTKRLAWVRMPFDRLLWIKMIKTYNFSYIKWRR